MYEDWFEKMEQYLNGEMSVEERSLLESEMKKDAGLSAAFEIYKSIETGMRNKAKHQEGEEALQDSIKNLDAIYFNKQISGKPVKATGSGQPVAREKIKAWKPLAIAATTVGIIAISILLYLHYNKDNEQTANTKTDTLMNIVKTDTPVLPKNISPGLAAQNNTDTATADKIIMPASKRAALFAGYFKADALPANTEGPLEDAFDYYQKQDYAAAAEEFTQADLNSGTRSLEADPKLTAFYAYYYAGISYLAGDEINKAVPVLNNALSRSPDSLFKVKTQWFLALAYIKEGDMPTATGLLNKISANNTETEYRSKAGMLLTELNKPVH